MCHIYVFFLSVGRFVFSYMSYCLYSFKFIPRKESTLKLREKAIYICIYDLTGKQHIASGVRKSCLAAKSSGPPRSSAEEQTSIGTDLRTEKAKRPRAVAFSISFLISLFCEVMEFVLVGSSCAHNFSCSLFLWDCPTLARRLTVPHGQIVGGRCELVFHAYVCDISL